MARMKGLDIKAGKTIPRHLYLGGELYVEEVMVAPNGKISAFVANTIYEFWADEDVAFPRRLDGSKWIWGLDEKTIYVEDFCIGDVIPPRGGWNSPQGTPILSEGYLVTSVTVGRRETTVTLWHSETERAYRLVSEDGPVFKGRKGAGELYGPWCTVGNYHLNRDENDEKKRAGMSNTSGYYSSMHGHPQTRFREKGMRGRPPFDSQPPPETREDWLQWILQDGQKPHSKDPRNQEG